MPTLPKWEWQDRGCLINRSVYSDGRTVAWGSSQTWPQATRLAQGRGSSTVCSVLFGDHVPSRFEVVGPCFLIAVRLERQRAAAAQGSSVVFRCWEELAATYMSPLPTVPLPRDGSRIRRARGGYFSRAVILAPFPDVLILARPTSDLPS